MAHDRERLPRARLRVRASPPGSILIGVRVSRPARCDEVSVDGSRIVVQPARGDVVLKIDRAGDLGVASGGTVRCWPAQPNAAAVASADRGQRRRCPGSLLERGVRLGQSLGSRGTRCACVAPCWRIASALRWVARLSDRREAIAGARGVPYVVAATPGVESDGSISTGRVLVGELRLDHHSLGRRQIGVQRLRLGPSADLDGQLPAEFGHLVLEFDDALGADQRHAVAHQRGERRDVVRARHGCNAAARRPNGPGKRRLRCRGGG